MQEHYVGDGRRSLRGLVSSGMYLTTVVRFRELEVVLHCLEQQRGCPGHLEAIEGEVRQLLGLLNQQPHPIPLVDAPILVSREGSSHTSVSQMPHN